MNQRRLKIIGIFIPNDRPNAEKEITECYIENPFQQFPFRLTIERIAFFIQKGKKFYYLDPFGKEISVHLDTPEKKEGFNIQTHADAPNSLLSLPHMLPRN